MRHARGQAIVELALVLPPLLVLAMGGVEVGRLADAREGLDAATAAAAAAAGRAPDATTAQAAAQAAFQASVAAYPVDRPEVALTLGTFARSGTAVATGTGTVALGFAPVPGLPASVSLTSTAAARIAPWRSR